MPKRLEKYVVKQTTQHGRTVYYFRMGKGPRIRLPDDPESEEFERAYLIARNGERPPAPAKRAANTSLEWLVGQYMKSGQWLRLAPATQRARHNIFKQSLAKSGSVDFKSINQKSMRKAVEDRSRTPAQANTFLKSMRGLFDWAVRNGHMDQNPTIGVEPIRYKSSGFPAWTTDDAAAFCEKWEIGTAQRLAFELLLLTGLRRSDIHRLGPQHLDGNILTIETKKTGARITIELNERIMGIIAKTKTGPRNFILGRGGPLAKDSFGNWFGDAARAAGIQKNAHGVRKLSATITAELGGSAYELMAHYGWKNIKEAEIYTRGADRARLGAASSKRIGEHIERALTPHQIPKRPSPPKK